MSKIYRCMTCSFISEVDNGVFVHQCINCSSQQLCPMPYITEATQAEAEAGKGCDICEDLKRG